MRKSALVFMSIAFIACHHEPASLSGTEKVDVKYFLAVFKKIGLPCRIADTNFIKAADTTIISYTVFSQFVPDSVLADAFGKNAQNLKAKPVGKFEVENKLYLLANIIQNKKIALVTFVFDNKNKYLSHLVLLQNGNKDDYKHSVSITSEPTFILAREKMNDENQLAYTRIGYGYNSSTKNFMTVVDDSNEDLKRLNEIINPIDTLPRKNKFSGDYADDSRNFISVRDGSNPSKYFFFVHFEKDDHCTGELKGEMKMRDATHAYYQQSGDACVIDFTFGSKSITFKEEGNCGNHRGIKCFFDDSYPKKKTKTTSTKNK
jgi:hypothetical protein